MKPFGDTLRIGIITAAFALYPMLAGAEPGETAKPDRSNEAESMLHGAPNQDATLRDENGATAGAPVENADPGMVKAPPKANPKMVEKPPAAGTDPGIHVPGTGPSGTPVAPK